MLMFWLSMIDCVFFSFLGFGICFYWLTTNWNKDRKFVHLRTLVLRGLGIHPSPWGSWCFDKSFTLILYIHGPVDRCCLLFPSPSPFKVAALGEDFWHKGFCLGIGQFINSYRFWVKGFSLLAYHALSRPTLGTRCLSGSSLFSRTRFLEVRFFYPWLATP